MRIALALSFPLLVLLSAGASSAEEGELSCAAQIEDLCPDTWPNSPERRACVRQGIEKLSLRCQQRLRSIRPGAASGAPPARPGATPAARPAVPPADQEHLRQFLKACGGDRARVAELCQKEDAPGSSLAECLRANQSEFSKPCQEWIRADAAAALAPAKREGAGTAPAAP